MALKLRSCLPFASAFQRTTLRASDFSTLWAQGSFSFSLSFRALLFPVRER